MSCYFLAQIRIFDQNLYQKYLDGFDAIFKNYQGKVLVVDDKPKVLEGKWQGTRIVLIRFTNQDEALNWYESEEYNKLRQFRQESSKADIYLLKGRE